MTPPPGPGAPRDPLRDQRQEALDALHELAALFLYQRDRIDWLAALEAEAGVPDPRIGNAVEMARRLLKTRAYLAADLGVGR